LVPNSALQNAAVLRRSRFDVIAGSQMRAARALLGIDQRDLARLSGLSLPTIQRMESSEGSVRAVVDSLEKVLDALSGAGIEMIADGAPSAGVGRGVRLSERLQKRPAKDAPRLGNARLEDGARPPARA
jgi:transcriptional regulator with XRE-family HTH domain